MKRESLGKPSPGIGEGSPRQSGINPGAESQSLGPTARADNKGAGELRAQLDHCPRISVHVGVCPAGAEAQKGDG